MFGNNPTEPWLRGHDGRELDVQEVFNTLQGEGPYAGRRAVFIRLAGCHLRCFFCDTDFTSRRHARSVEQLAHACLHTHGAGFELVVLTGGEPMRQNIVPLCEALAVHGKHVQIETAGNLWVPPAVEAQFEQLLADGDVSIVVSPKTAQVHRNVQRWARAWKYIIDAGTAVDEATGLPMESTQEEGRAGRLFHPDLTALRGARVYLQPMDRHDPEHNRAAVERCVELCMLYGHTLSIQQHKVVGLP